MWTELTKAGAMTGRARRGEKGFDLELISKGNILRRGGQMSMWEKKFLATVGWGGERERADIKKDEAKHRTMTKKILAGCL